MSSILELACQIVSSHVSSTPMSKEELVAELEAIHETLIALVEKEPSTLVESKAATSVNLKKIKTPTPSDSDSEDPEERWLLEFYHS